MLVSSLVSSLQPQHARNTSRAADSSAAAQLPCHTCKTSSGRETYSSTAASADKKEHPQPARRNCSHQGSQWKEKYCLFRPWCPLVAATFLTQQATQPQHARTTSQAAGSPSAAQLPCHTCQTKHTAASSAAADKEKHPQPARRNCSHQGSQWKEKYCLFRPWCPLCKQYNRNMQETHQEQLIAPRLPNFPVTHARPQAAEKHTAAQQHPPTKRNIRRNCSHQGSQWKENYCLFRPVLFSGNSVLSTNISPNIFLCIYRIYTSLDRNSIRSYLHLPLTSRVSP